MPDTIQPVEPAGLLLGDAALEQEVKDANKQDGIDGVVEQPLGCLPTENLLGLRTVVPPHRDAIGYYQNAGFIPMNNAGVLTPERLPEHVANIPIFVDLIYYISNKLKAVQYMPMMPEIPSALFGSVAQIGFDKIHTTHN